MRLLEILSKTLSSAATVRRNSKAAHRVVRDVLRTGEVDPNLLHPFLNYDPDSLLVSIASKASAATAWIGAAISVVVGTLFAAFPAMQAGIKAATPWLELGNSLHDAFNYLHGIHKSTVADAHLVYHIADLGLDLALISPMYVIAAKALVIFGWRHRINPIKRAVRALLDQGRCPPGSPYSLRWKMRPGYTGIMVGDGDELGDEFVRAHGCDEALLFASRRQSSAEIWVHIGNDAGVADLEAAFRTASFAQCGRLVLLPVQSQHMVFPPNDAYDISPDRLDDLLRNIRLLERKRRGEDPPRDSPLPLIVVGDKKQTTVIHTYDPEGHGLLPEESTSINLASILREHGDGLTVIDPTDLVLERIVRTAAGARIVFRGTDESRKLYEPHFVRRLEEMGYRATDPGRVFRMGYNITDDPTVADAMNSAAVVLTASARDALREKGYPEDRILYVPGIVIGEIEARIRGS